jgi:uncharacterized protein (DUF58 family)
MVSQDMVREETPRPLADLDTNREILSKRRLWYALAVVLLILSLLLQQPLILLAGIFTLLVGIVPEIWFRRALRHLVLRQQLSERHLFFGETATLALTVENRKLLPVPWLEVESSISPPLSVVSGKDSRRQVIHRDALVSTWLLWSYQRVTRRYHLRCHARGFHRFGPIALSCSDPFGWLERELRADAYETLLVYPLIAPIEALLPAANPMGERVGPRQLLEDPLWFAGNREYQPGDDPRRIDWKATARVGELRSKIYESTVARRMLVLLDTWTYMADVNGIDFELQEFCISTAASLAIWGLEEGYMVGLLTNSSAIEETGEAVSQVNTDDIVGTLAELQYKKPNTVISVPGVSVPFAQDHEQYTEILTTLARLVPNYNTPIEHVIEQEEEMLQPGSTILLVSSLSTLSETTIEQLLQLRARGNSVSLVLVGILLPGQEMVETFDLPVFMIGGREKWHELIRTVGEGKSDIVGTSTTAIELG